MAANSKSIRKTVDEVIDDLPKEEQLVVRRLRSIILECLPQTTEKMDGVLIFLITE